MLSPTQAASHGAAQLYSVNSPLKGKVMLRTAIVGLGSWGQTLVSSVQGKSDALRFVAGQTRTPAKVEAFCREKGIRLAASFEEILNDPGIDAVVLATPNSQHGGQIVQAAQNVDMPMVMGSVILVAVVMSVVNLAVDVLYAVLDPRVAYE